MVLIVTQKNEETLELFKLELASRTKILECTLKDNEVKLSSVKYNGLYSVGIYRTLIGCNNINDIKLIVPEELIYIFAKEIILMLTGLNIIEKWDSNFWDNSDSIYTPKINAMVKHIESMIVYKVVAA